MTNILQKAVVDAANEVAQWKMRAYIAEARVAELEAEAEEVNGDE